MSNLTKLGGIIAAISLTAYLQGCSSGDSLVQQLDPLTADSVTTISGSAVKGILRNADCIVTDTASGEVIYSTVPGSRVPSDGLDTTCTSAQGRYSIPVLVPAGRTVVVEIVARSGSTEMICDKPTGCAGGVAFGAAVNQLGDNFSMRAIVPAVDTDQSSLEVSVTPWTEMATARAVAGNSGNVTGLTTASTQTAYQEVASILNNILSLEGTDDAFDGNFFDIPVPDLSNPATDIVTNAADQKRAALLSIVTGSLLELTSDTVTPATVVSNLANSFSGDGELNVNDDADGIVTTDTVNLASLVRNVATTVTTLATAITNSVTAGTADADALTNLTTLLGGSDITTELSTIEIAATTLADAKDAVEDAALDPTKPKEVAATGTTAFTLAKNTVISLVNIVNAANGGLDTDATGNFLGDLSTVLDSTNAEYEDGLILMAELMEGAASMIYASATAVPSSFGGCTVVASTSITCTATQLAATLDDPWADLNTATAGEIVYTASTNQVVATGVTAFGGIELALTLTGGTDTSSNPSYTVAAGGATVKLPADVESGTDLADITFGATTISGVSGSASSFTVDASDVTIDLADFLIEADLDATRDLTLRDTLLTNFRLSGMAMIKADTQVTGVATANEGKSLNFTVAFSGNVSGLPENPTGLPMPQDETEDNFLAASDIVFDFSFPTTFNVVSLSTDGANVTTADDASAGVFSVRAVGVRNDVKGGDVTQLVLGAVGGGVNAQLTGDLTVSSATVDGVETYTSTYTLGDDNNVITLTIAETDTSRTVGGTMATTADVAAGSITANGTFTVVNPEDSTESAAITVLPLILQSSQ